MRNINTSFAKNAFSLFANEASNTLRASVDPATFLLHLIKSPVQGYLQYLAPVINRHPALQPGTFGGQTTMSGRQRPAMSSSGQALSGERGNRRWDCRLSLNQV